MNILHLIDSILMDWVSPRVRRTIHSVLLIASLLFAIWLSVGGDWKQAVIALAAAFYAASNRSNTIPNLTPAGFHDPSEYTLNPTCCKNQQSLFGVSGNPSD